MVSVVQFIPAGNPIHWGIVVVCVVQGPDFGGFAVRNQAAGVGAKSVYCDGAHGVILSLMDTATYRVFLLFHRTFLTTRLIVNAHLPLVLAGISGIYHADR